MTAVYRIAYAPRYAGEPDDRELAELFLSQKTFWEGLYFGKQESSVSVLWFCSQEGQQVELYLSFQLEGLGNAELGSVDELLPIEYGWERLPSGSMDVSSRVQGSRKCCIIELRRRLQFLNLPHSLGRGQPQRSDERPKAAISATAKTRLLLERRNLPLFAIRDPVSGATLHEFCAPILAEILDLYPNNRRLCEELQRNAPALVVLTLHGVPSEALENDRIEAMIYSRCLDELTAGLANAGFANVPDLYRVYHRYLLGKAGLCHLTMRVAAETARKAAAVAYRLCARSGGMKTFSIRQVNGGDWDDKALVSRIIRADGSLTDEELKGIDHILQEERVTPVNDPNHKAFLLRFPHLYTTGELETLFRLPIGDDKGLPGLETRLLPPFFSSAARLNRVIIDGCFATPPPDRLRVGRVESVSVRGDPSEIDSRARWHTIPKDDLCKHALIVGSTGSGKTVTTTFFMRELLRLHVPFLIVEPVKTEYATELAALCDLQRFKFEPELRSRSMHDFLSFDPMRLQEGVSVARHISHLKSCFEAAFPLEPWMALFLENSLMAYYTGPKAEGCCGLDLFAIGGRSAHAVDARRLKARDPIDRSQGERPERAIYPSFDTFRDFFLYSFLDREFGKGDGTKNDWSEQHRQLFKRRFTNLSQGPMGRAFDRADEAMLGTNGRLYDPIDGQRLFESPTVIELDAITDADQKALIMAFLLTFLFEKRQVEDAIARSNPKKAERDRDPKHVLVIEEAHRLLANTAALSNRGNQVVGQDAKAKAVSLFVDMLAEIRAWRQGIFIVEQIPTKIVPEAVKNTNLKIMMRTTAKEDRDYLGSAMNFNERQKLFVSNLRAAPDSGIQFVVFEEGVDQPVLLTLPHPKDKLRDEANIFDRYFR
jgi:hypothetical protein